MKAVQPVLTEHGFAVNQMVKPVEDGRVGIVTIITHKDGYAQYYGPLPMPVTNDPKAVGSAITYGRRYALAAALGIATDEDTDAAGTEPKKAKTDHHDRAWKAATLLFERDDQVGQFFAALREAGVGEGKRATKAQADKVIGLMEDLAK